MKFSFSYVLLTYIGMLCMGKSQYGAVHEMDDDQEFYKYALSITRSIPSEETLRQRMDDIGSSLRSRILAENVEMLNMNGIVPTKLPKGREFHGFRNTLKSAVNSHANRLNNL